MDTMVNDFRPQPSAFETNAFVAPRTAAPRPAKPGVKAWAISLAALGLVAGGVLVGPQIVSPSVTAAVAMPPPSVVVSAPLQRDVAGRLEFLGQFSAVQKVELRAQVGGTL